MPERLVLDASAALALVLGEPAGPIVRAAVARPDVELLVPPGFWTEIVNVLVRRYRCPPDEVVAALQALDQLDVATVDGGRPMLLLALDLATRHQLSAYDAAYLAAAELADADLLTLDERLAAAAGARAVPATAHRLAEGRVGYGNESAPPDWSRHGRYLADLRRAAGA